MAFDLAGLPASLEQFNLSGLNQSGVTPDDKGTLGGMSGLEIANLLNFANSIIDPEGTSAGTIRKGLSGPNLIALLNKLKAQQTQGGIKKGALGSIGLPGRPLEFETSQVVGGGIAALTGQTKTPGIRGTQGSLLRTPTDEVLSPMDLTNVLRTFQP